MLDGDHNKAGEYVGVGGLAQVLGVSPSSVRKWEAAGVIPMAGRMEPRSQRVWAASDLETIRERVAAKRSTRRQHGDRVSVA